MSNEENNNKTSPILYVITILGILYILSGLYTTIQYIITTYFSESIEKTLAMANSSKEDFYNGADVGSTAKIYNFISNDYYNNIIEFKENNIPVYVFSMNTDTEIGNSGIKFDYEIGRIYINEQNPNKSKCTYNYNAKLSNLSVKYFECSESQFIKSIPQISKLKTAKYEEYKKTLEEERNLDICGYGGMEEDERCKNIPDSHFSEQYFNEIQKKHDKQLTDIRNTTL